MVNNREARNLARAAKGAEGELRGAYMRALTDPDGPDWPNVDNAQKQLLELGLPTPSPSEVLRYKKRKRGRLRSLTREARRRYPALTSGPIGMGIGE